MSRYFVCAVHPPLPPGRKTFTDGTKVPSHPWLPAGVSPWEAWKGDVAQEVTEGWIFVPLPPSLPGHLILRKKYLKLRKQQADDCMPFQYRCSTRVSLGFFRKRMLKSVRGLLRDNDSGVEMGRKQDWAERTSDYRPDLTEFQPRRDGTRSDDDAESRPTPVRSPRVLAVIVTAGLLGKGQFRCIRCMVFRHETLFFRAILADSKIELEA